MILFDPLRESSRAKGRNGKQPEKIPSDAKNIRLVVWSFEESVCCEEGWKVSRK